MSKIEIIKVQTKSERKQFARFGNKLYEDSDYYVPDLEFDLLDTFDEKKNAAFEFSEAQMFLAKRDGKIVGRVAAIINHRANETWNVKNVRFSYIDFIDDKEVSAALLKTVEDWGRERGMTNCQGPMGFTDFDKEGMLTSGFDQMGSMISYYNHPYYLDHMDCHGYEKEADWVQLRCKVPTEVPERFLRGTELVRKRYNLRVVKPTKDFMLKQGYGRKMFELLNEAYAPLFGFSKLSDKQIDSYIGLYIQLLDLKFITCVFDENDNMIAVAITMGSLAHALRKTKGKLFPFGWFHLLRSLRFKLEKTVDLLLIAIHPSWQGKGINSLLFADLIPIYIESGFEYAETGPQLEDNHKERNQWTILNPEAYQTRRCYHKSI